MLAPATSPTSVILRSRASGDVRIYLLFVFLKKFRSRELAFAPATWGQGVAGRHEHRLVLHEL